MKAMFTVMLLVAVGAGIMPAAARADQVDNPQFVAWSTCAVGSSVTYDKATSGEQVVLQIKETLKEKADDHVANRTHVGAAGTYDEHHGHAVAKLGMGG